MENNKRSFTDAISYEDVEALIQKHYGDEFNVKHIFSLSHQTYGKVIAVQTDQVPSFNKNISINEPSFYLGNLGFVRLKDKKRSEEFVDSFARVSSIKKEFLQDYIQLLKDKNQGKIIGGKTYKESFSDVYNKIDDELKYVISMLRAKFDAEAEQIMNAGRCGYSDDDNFDLDFNFDNNSLELIKRIERKENMFVNLKIAKYNLIKKTFKEIEKEVFEKDISKEM